MRFNQASKELVATEGTNLAVASKELVTFMKNKAKKSLRLSDSLQMYLPNKGTSYAASSLKLLVTFGNLL